uniref:RNA-directed DNA polymerase n=1 Tax=Caenorhabditis japonica TaxID=281687 RepID=A0A8R1I900_CAEJA
MEAVVGDMLGKSAFVYVDDLLIASETLKQHQTDLREILTRIRGSGMKLRASKCHIAQKEVEYLGHRITPDGVKTEEAKVEKMRKFSRPTNSKELQSFLGLVGYYRKFILNFAQTASALTPLTSKNCAWKWETEQESAFQLLLEAVCTIPVLMQQNVEAAMNGSKPFAIYTDASKKGVGAVLAQEGEDGQQHPIAFASKASSPAETRYHITDLEALAMMFALRRFKTIIYGTPTIFFTDHRPLMYLLKGTPLADRLLRWSIEILEFNIKIVFLAGKANSVADALSRGGCPPIEAEEIETAEMQKIISEIRRSDALEEEGWKELIQMLESGKTQGSVKIPGLKKEVFMEEYMLVGNFLRNSESEEYNRRVVPLKARHELIKQAYEGCWAAHFGTEELWRQLSKRIFWPKMRAHIENVVKGCPKCICTNDQPKLTAPLTPYKTSAPLEIVACDLIDVGLSTQGNRYILSIIDFQFTKLMKIEHIMTKGYNSRANGAVERFNKTLMHTMKKRTAVPFEWDDQVAFSVYAYNNSAHSTTGESPMFLMCGRDSMGPLEMAGEDAVGINYSDVDEYKCLLKQELIKVHKIVKEHADKEQYSLPGSRVLVEVPSEKLGVQCPKLVNKWRGPYRVVACSNNLAKIVPILGKMSKILEIPFDNLRIIPPQMDDIHIKTNVALGGDQSGVAVGYSLVAFGVPDAMSERRSHANKEMLLYMSHCPTLYLCCKDVLGWEQVYHQAYQEIMDAKVGTELLNPCKVMVLLDPVVHEGAVPIMTKDIIGLTQGIEDQIITTMVNGRFQLLIFVIPVILDAAKVEVWTRCRNGLQRCVLSKKIFR